MWDDTFYIELQISSLFMLYLLHIFGLDLMYVCFRPAYVKRGSKKTKQNTVFLCMEKHYNSKNYPRKFFFFFNLYLPASSSDLLRIQKNRSLQLQTDQQSESDYFNCITPPSLSVIGKNKQRKQGAPWVICQNIAMATISWGAS